MKFITNSSEETTNIGYKIGKILKGGDVVLLDGYLSAGKTMFTKGIGKALGVTKVINSPTFTIVKEYSAKDIKLYHMDLYRLDGLGNDFDLYEYFSDQSICVIEWPFQVKELLPDEFLRVKIKTVSQYVREITFEGKGNRYKELLGEIECIR